MSTPLRVLVIDDNEDIRSVIQLSLEKEGFEVRGAGNGREAAQILRNGGIGVVLTDILMPEQDGIETIVQLRAEFPEIKIIAMSGASSVTGFDYLKVPGQLGARILRKPFEMRELVKLVRELA